MNIEGEEEYEEDDGLEAEEEEEEVSVLLFETHTPHINAPFSDPVHTYHSNRNSSYSITHPLTSCGLYSLCLAGVTCLGCLRCLQCQGV